MLLHLESFKVLGECENTDFLQEILDLICQHTHKRPSDHHALSKLAQVTVSYSNNDNVLLPIFALLPSVKTLKASDFDGSRFAFGGDWWQRRKLPSQVTTIKLQRSLLSCDWFENFPELSNLRDFKYHCQKSENASRLVWWEPGDITRYLSQHAAHSLVSLETKTQAVEIWIPPWNCGPSLFIWELVKFKILANLRVDHTLFIKDNTWDCQLCEDNKTEQVNHADPWRGCLKRIPRDRFCPLVDALPVSLETLTLVKGYGGPDELGRLYDGLAELKSTRLPKLWKITLEGGLILSDESLRECSKAGIIVDIDE